RGWRGNSECEIEGRHANLPANGMAGVCSSARPDFRGRRKLKVRCAQRRGASLGVNKCSSRERIDRAIFPSDLKEHELRVIIQLYGKPIPSNLICLQLMSEEFVVHPGEADDGILLSVERERTGGRQTSFREIV